MSDYRIEWKLNLSLLEMIRISEENEKEMKQRLLLEKTVALQQMERQKRIMEIEKGKEIEEMSKECKLAKEKMETETRRADALSLHSLELSFRAAQAETELNELKMKCERELPNSIDYVVCNDCLDEFKRKKMKMCMECAERKTSPPILCGFCVFEKHSNHRVIDYLPHLINDSFSSVVANGNLTSTNSQTESSKKIEKGYECMEEWRKELNKFSNAVDLEEISYRDSLEIASSLRKETDVILRASNGVLPKLEEFARTVQESSARLLVLHLSLTKDSTEVVDRKDICVPCTVESFRYLEGFNQPWSCNQRNDNCSLFDSVNLHTTQKRSGMSSKLNMDVSFPMILIIWNVRVANLWRKEKEKICGSDAEEWNKEWKGMKEGGASIHSVVTTRMITRNTTLFYIYH